VRYVDIVAVSSSSRSVPLSPRESVRMGASDKQGAKEKEAKEKERGKQAKELEKKKKEATLKKEKEKKSKGKQGKKKEEPPAADSISSFVSNVFSSFASGDDAGKGKKNKK
jgi:uncharacterized protein with gpF-like domain